MRNGTERGNTQGRRRPEQRAPSGTHAHGRRAPPLLPRCAKEARTREERSCDDTALKRPPASARAAQDGCGTSSSAPPYAPPGIIAMHAAQPTMPTIRRAHVLLTEGDIANRSLTHRNHSRKRGEYMGVWTASAARRADGGGAPSHDALRDTARASVEAEANRLVETYADTILRVSYTYLHSTQDAEDICQDVLLKPSTVRSASNRRGTSAPGSSASPSTPRRTSSGASRDARPSRSTTSPSP